jgi:hypothetical protein
MVYYFKVRNVSTNVFYPLMKSKTPAISFLAKNALLWLPCALAITLFLFFIDEGAYSLSWKDLQRDWGILLGNVLGIAIAQSFLAYLLKNYRAIIRIPIAFVLGIPLGFMLLFGSVALFALASEAFS